jgi:catechol 2,3-dioxygenase-like lactoylglutathione lyase family enzyme
MRPGPVRGLAPVVGVTAADRLAAVAVTPLLQRLEIIQVAVVVRDLEASAARQSRLLGNGPWRVYEFGPHMMKRYEHNGVPATGRTLVALNDTHPQVEILQPLSGRSIHQDWLDEHGEGLHHIAAIVESVDAVVAAADDDGIGVLSSGEGFGVDGSGKFAYLDTRSSVGMILEVIEPPTGLGDPIRRL